MLRGNATVYTKETHEQENGIIEPVLLDVSVVRGVKDRARFGTELCTLRK